MLVVVVFLPRFSSFFIWVVLFHRQLPFSSFERRMFDVESAVPGEGWEEAMSIVVLLSFQFEVIDAFRLKMTSPALSTLSFRTSDASRCRGEQTEGSVSHYARNEQHFPCFSSFFLVAFLGFLPPAFAFLRHSTSSELHIRAPRKALTLKTSGWAVDARCFYFVRFSTSKSPSSPTILDAFSSARCFLVHERTWE